jgi:hypothetical protein
MAYAKSSRFAITCGLGDDTFPSPQTVGAELYINDHVPTRMFDPTVPHQRRLNVTALQAPSKPRGATHERCLV